MEAVLIILSIMGVFGFIALLGAGIVYLFIQLRAGEPIRIPLRLVLRVYIYAVTAVGLVLFTLGGMSNLLQAGMGATFEKEFSYRPLFKEPSKPLVRVEEPNGLTFEEVQELTEEQEKAQEEARQEGLDRAMKEGLINGISLTIIGALIWGIHLVGRRRLESPEERGGPLNRIYLIVVVVIFSIITITSLAQGVPQTIRYILLDPLDEFGRRSTPGDALAVAIVALPIWITYLVGTIRVARRA